VDGETAGKGRGRCEGWPNCWVVDRGHCMRVDGETIWRDCGRCEGLGKLLGSEQGTLHESGWENHVEGLRSL